MENDFTLTTLEVCIWRRDDIKKSCFSRVYANIKLRGTLYVFIPNIDNYDITQDRPVPREYKPLNEFFNNPVYNLAMYDKRF